MSALDTAKEVVRIASTAGLAKDVIDLMEKKLALLTSEVAVLTREQDELKTKNRNLEAENGQLRAKLQLLQPVAHGLSDDQVHILRLLDQEHGNIPIAKVAARLSLDVPRVEYLIIGLLGGNYILDVQTGLRITDKGRIFVHESLV